MEKVFCQDCNYHFEDWDGEEYPDDEVVEHYCKLTRRDICSNTPLKKVYQTYYDNCEDKNKNNTCPDFWKKQNWFRRNLIN